MFFGTPKGRVAVRRGRPGGSIRRASLAVAFLVALGIFLAATPGGEAVASTVQTRTTLARLRRAVPYPLQMPASLPVGTRLVETTTALSQGEGATAKLHYRMPTPTGDVGLILHQSHPEHPFRLVLRPEQVLERPQIGAQGGILYSSGGPPGGPPLLIVTWDDGAYHLELWGALSAEELIAIARSVRPER